MYFFLKHHSNIFFLLNFTCSLNKQQIFPDKHYELTCCLSPNAILLELDHSRKSNILIILRDFNTPVILLFCEMYSEKEKRERKVIKSLMNRISIFFLLSLINNSPKHELNGLDLIFMFQLKRTPKNVKKFLATALNLV